MTSLKISIENLASQIAQLIKDKENILPFINIREKSENVVCRIFSPYGEKSGAIVKIFKSHDEFNISLLIWIPVTNQNRQIGWTVISKLPIKQDTNLKLVARMVVDFLLNPNIGSFKMKKFPCHVGQTLPKPHAAAAIIIDRYIVNKIGGLSITVFDRGGKSFVIRGKEANLAYKNLKDLPGKYLVIHDGGLIRFLSRERFEGAFQPVYKNDQPILNSNQTKENLHG